MASGRWYGSLTRHEGPHGVVQMDSQVRDAAWDRGGPLRLPEHVLRLAQAEYDRQFPGQPYERMQERCGLSLLEVVGLLADLAERHGAKPSLPATKDGDRWLMPPPPDEVRRG